MDSGGDREGPDTQESGLCWRDTDKGVDDAPLHSQDTRNTPLLFLLHSLTSEYPVVDRVLFMSQSRLILVETL